MAEEANARTIFIFAGYLAKHGDDAIVVNLPWTRHRLSPARLLTQLSKSANLRLEVNPAMLGYLRLAYHAAQVLFGAGVLGMAIKWMYKRYRQSLENRVLSTFRNTDPDGEWRSAHGVVGELGLKAALSDAPGFFPPREPRLRSRLRTAFYRCRHSFRRAFIIPDKEKADRVLRDLWERGLLVRAGWRHTDNEFYKLRN